MAALHRDDQHRLTATNHAAEPLPGYQAVRSFVFAGIYPTDTTQYEPLRDALER